VRHRAAPRGTIKEPAVLSGWTPSLAALRALARKTGPYLAIELVVPGGTLVALLLFLYQNRREGEPAHAALRRHAVSAWRRLRTRTRCTLATRAPAAAVK
jgi:hypothetical protein